MAIISFLPEFHAIVLSRLYQSHPILCLVIVTVPVFVAGIALRFFVIDVPEINRICADTAPPRWCSLRALVINADLYIASIFAGLLALRYSSLHLSAISIAIGIFGLFSFNPDWSIANPDWSICGLMLGLLAFIRCKTG